MIEFLKDAAKGFCVLLVLAICVVALFGAVSSIGAWVLLPFGVAWFIVLCAVIGAMIHE